MIIKSTLEKGSNLLLTLTNFVPYIFYSFLNFPVLHFKPRYSSYDTADRTVRFDI